MLQFMSNQSAAIKEVELLKERLVEFDGATPVRKLDPNEIVPSHWANRHPASFEGADFASLKDEIAGAGENVQPIRVRPLKEVLNGSTPSAKYEVVFGHRRHRACLELGLPVNALIQDASDQQLFEAMERENRGRKNLSAWEQGCMYRRALDEGLYPSLRKLAEAVQVDVSLVSKSIALARLPHAVISAFPSPLEIQFRWAQPLGDALQKDPDGVLERAKRLKASSAKLTGAQVLEALLAPKASEQLATVGKVRKIGRGARAATLKVASTGTVSLTFSAGAVTAGRQDELVKLIEAFLAGE
jgi:ParB family chromosome partitioning protein